MAGLGCGGAGRGCGGAGGTWPGRGQGSALVQNVGESEGKRKLRRERKEGRERE